MNYLFIEIIALTLFSTCIVKNDDHAANGVKPSIVLILADDMGYGDIEAYNPTSKLPTPNLNNLAEEGMRFTDAHTNSSVCTPTRYGLLTGRYAWRTRLKRGVLSGYSNHLIDPQRETIADMLQRAGYKTGVVGKWHLGVDFPWINDSIPSAVDNLNYCAEQEIDYTKTVQNGPNSMGFDYSFIVPGSLDMSPYVYLENGKATTVPDSISPRVPFPAFTRRGEIAPDFTHQTALDRLTEKAVDFINEQADSSQPFLLYFPLTGPHKPALVAERFEGSSGFGPYGDLVAQVDWTVGEVLKALENNHMRDNTIVIYTSDNGSYMFRIDEGKDDHVANSAIQGYHANTRQSNYIWRGTKADIFEGGHRIPFIVRWPGHVRPRSENASTICITDVKATLSEIIGLQPDQDSNPDSFSFLSQLKGKQAATRSPVIHHSANGTFSIRHGKWKMIFSNGSGGRQKPAGKPFQTPYQLYDMINDPTETENVIDMYPEVVKILSGYLESIRVKGTSHIDLAG